MSTQENRREVLQGTLDLLILRTLIFGPQHGQGIARAIQQTSEQELLVEHGALYPALPRLEDPRLPGREAQRDAVRDMGNVLEQPQGAVLFADGHGT